VHALGGTGEAAFVDHADQCVQEFQIKHGGNLLIDNSTVM
jgi:hypothetical protein